MSLEDPLTKKLLQLCKNNPDSRPEIEKSNEDTIKYLLARVRSGPSSPIEHNLIRALELKSSHTKCVLVTQFYGHKLMYNKRKLSLPVACCKLWRWPGLKSQHHLLIRKNCENHKYRLSSMSAYHPQRQCINPYHYRRHKPKRKEEFLIPLIPPDLSSSFDDSDPTPGTRALPGPRAFQFNPMGDILRDLLLFESVDMQSTI